MGSNICIHFISHLFLDGMLSLQINTNNLFQREMKNFLGATLQLNSSAQCDKYTGNPFIDSNASLLRHLRIAEHLLLLNVQLYDAHDEATSERHEVKCSSDQVCVTHATGRTEKGIMEQKTQQRTFVRIVLWVAQLHMPSQTHWSVFLLQSTVWSTYSRDHTVYHHTFTNQILKASHSTEWVSGLAFEDTEVEDVYHFL